MSVEQLKQAMVGGRFMNPAGGVMTAEHAAAHLAKKMPLQGRVLGTAVSKLTPSHDPVNSAAMEAVFGKHAADNGKIPNNEDETNKGVNDVRKDPAERTSGTLDASWGDKPPPPETYGTATRREAQDGRGALLDRILDAGKASAPAEQALMRQHFEHAAEGQPHSPILQRGHKTASADEPTLTDQVMAVVGHR